MPITELTSSPGEVGLDIIRTRVNEVIQELSLTTSPLAASPGEISIDAIRSKINELLEEIDAGGGSAPTTETLLTASGEDIVLADGVTTLDLA